MTGFEPDSSGIVSDRSANCATTTSQVNILTWHCVVTDFAELVPEIQEEN